MRLVIQRVRAASVSIDSKPHASIQKGLLVFVGICENDTHEDAKWLALKVTKMRIFNDAEGKMNLSLTDINGELLIVSQFTLYADTKKGNRPSFIRAAKPDFAIPLYDFFIEECLFASAIKPATGIFGADMQISILNDGPVTIIIDSKNKE